MTYTSDGPHHNTPMEKLDVPSWEVRVTYRASDGSRTSRVIVVTEPEVVDTFSAAAKLDARFLGIVEEMEQAVGLEPGGRLGYLRHRVNGLAKRAGRVAQR